MDISNITRMISALRAQTSPNSITPEGLGSILQRIADLIGALSQINTSEATDLIARVSAAEADAETARQAAQNALTASEANVVDSFTYEQTDRVLQLLLKQHGHETHSINLPGATTTFAGLLTAIDKYHLDVAYDKRLKDLYTTKTPSSVTLNFKKHDDTVDQVTFVAATSTEAGLMTAEDKSKLVSLESTIQNIQDWQQTVTSKFENEVALIDSENGRIVVGYEHPILLYGMGAGLDGPDAGSCPVGGSYWDPEQKMIWNRVQPRVFLPISPSQSVIYTNFYTGKKYAWVPNGQEGEMVEVSDLTENMPSGGGMPMSADVYQAIQYNVETLRSMLYALIKTWLANLAFNNGRPSDPLLSAIASQFTWPDNDSGSGGGGSDTPTGDPSLTVYVDGVAVSNVGTINVGTNTGNGVSKTITIKGSNLTQSLNVVVNGTGFALSADGLRTSAIISNTDANNGKSVTVYYTGTNTNGESGSLSISSLGTGDDNISRSVTITATYSQQGGGDEPTPTPTLDVDPTSLAFNTTAGQTESKTFTVTGRNLTGNVQISSNSNLFTFEVTSGSLTPDNNGIVDATVTVTYEPTAAGTHSGIITVSSTGATSQSVGLSGTATAAVASKKVVYKLLNYTPPTGASSSNNPFGYYEETLNTAADLIKTLATNNATANGDLTVKSGGVVKFNQRTATLSDTVYSQNGITFDTSTGELTIPTSVLGGLTDDLIIEATACTGIVTVKASESGVTATIEGTTITCSTSNGDGTYSGSASGITSINSMSFSDKTKIVSIDFGGAKFTGSTLASAFSGCTALTQFKGLVVTGSVTSLASMFENCSSLISLEAIGWNMPSLTSLYAFLYKASNITKFDASTWYAPNVANLHGMFASCNKLEEIDISGISTKYVNENAPNTMDIAHMFHLSPNNSDFSLTKLTIGKFDTSNVTNIETFFWLTTNASIELHCKSRTVPNISSTPSLIWFGDQNQSNNNRRFMIGSVYVPTGCKDAYYNAWAHVDLGDGNYANYIGLTKEDFYEE